MLESYDVSDVFISMDGSIFVVISKGFYEDVGFLVFTSSNSLIYNTNIWQMRRGKKCYRGIKDGDRLWDALHGQIRNHWLLRTQSVSQVLWFGGTPSTIHHLASQRSICVPLCTVLNLQQPFFHWNFDIFSLLHVSLCCNSDLNLFYF